MPDNNEFAARYIAQRLMKCQQGPPEDPQTWGRVADRRGHEWQFFHDVEEGAGEYLSAEPASGIIRVNTAYPRPDQAKAFIHELAHAELNTLPSSLAIGQVPGFLGGAWMGVRQGYEGEGGGHQIARRVEEIVFSQSCPLPVSAEEVLEEAGCLPDL